MLESKLRYAKNNLKTRIHEMISHQMQAFEKKMIEMVDKMIEQELNNTMINKENSNKIPPITKKTFIDSETDVWKSMLKSMTENEIQDLFKHKYDNIQKDIKKDENKNNLNDSKAELKEKLEASDVNDDDSDIDTVELLRRASESKF